MVNYVRGTTPKQRKQIVEEFCGVCDDYKPGKSCGIENALWSFGRGRGQGYGPNQERYAMKSLCGWARVNGERATLRDDVVEFKNGRTVPRSGLKKKIDEIEVIEPPKLPTPNDT